MRKLLLEEKQQKQQQNNNNNNNRNNNRNNNNNKKRKQQQEQQPSLISLFFSHPLGEAPPPTPLFLRSQRDKYKLDQTQTPPKQLPFLLFFCPVF